MSARLYLGIDAGGTHTDAALLQGNGDEKILLAGAKVKTCHEDLSVSVRDVLSELSKTLGVGSAGTTAEIAGVTLGATLAVNALAQDKADAVGLALSAGPGLNALRFAIGEHVCLVPGGVDHRGFEVVPLQMQEMNSAAKIWKNNGLSACACVGKFSPRNPSHERMMAAGALGVGFSVTQGHRLSGSLNFPRRIATAYYNAAVERLHHTFLDAVTEALDDAGISAPSFLIKADGGAVPLPLSRLYPVQSILSGPAASVMGILALCPSIKQGCSLLLDMGGSTTDIALVVDGSPVLEHDGMVLNGRRTLVRSLASVSVGVGGDSSLTVDGADVHAGPMRLGQAMAFGGDKPTLLDALNTHNALNALPIAGDSAASAMGLMQLAPYMPGGATANSIAEAAICSGMARIRQAVEALVKRLNSKPVYTLAALKAAREIKPERIVLVGGPAACVRGHLEKYLGLPVETPLHADIANAIGAGLTLPTAALEIYADTGRGILRAPALDIEERIGGDFSLESAILRAKDLLEGHLAEAGVSEASLEVVEAELFATLSNDGYGAKDIRVVCQVAPNLAGRLYS